jgi:hypothetical protein
MLSSLGSPGPFHKLEFQFDIPTLSRKNSKRERVYSCSCQRPTTDYFVLPPSTFSLSVAAACAAANRAVSTRKGEHET